MAKKTNNKWSDIGDLRVREFTDDDGNTQQVPYLVIDRSIKIFKGVWDKEAKEYKDFTEVDLGDFRIIKCTDPSVSPHALNKGGHITDDELQKRLEYIEEKNIKKKLTVPPVDDN